MTAVVRCVVSSDASSAGRSRRPWVQISRASNAAPGFAIATKLAVIVGVYGDDASDCLESLCDGVLGSLSVHYVGVSGPLRERFTTLEDFTESAFESPAGTGASPLRRSYQDLQHLGFVDGSFDLVVSSHVMEHVPDPDRAFREVHRVLRPGGRYICSMPMRRSGATLTRAVMRDGEVEHLEPERYHNSPSGGALVFNDFGDDLLDRLTGLGFSATVARPTENMSGYLNAVVVAHRAEDQKRTGELRR